MQYPFPELIDSSMLAAFKSCPQLFYKTYIQDYKSKGLSVHLKAGGAFAKGIEITRVAYYEQAHSIDDAIAKGLQALIEAYGDYQCPADSAKSLERMCGAFEFYWSNYPLSDTDCTPITLPGGKRGIEFSFAQPIPIAHPESGDPLIYCGRLDALLNYAGGIFMCDEKTTTQLGASWSRQWDLRSQFTGYAWGCRENGIKVDGVIVRGVSILKTKYDTQQAISYRPEWAIDRWYAEMLEWVKDIKECWRTGRWRHNLDHACAEYGGCQFREACSSQDEGPWLETYFERRKWNPLLRTETLVG